VQSFPTFSPGEPGRGRPLIGSEYESEGRKPMGRIGMPEKQLFDDWPERYDRWFETPVGKAVLHYESELILDLLQPGNGERILDAGSGTGIFTREFLARGAEVVGLDISLAMLVRAAEKTALRQALNEMRSMPVRGGEKTQPCLYPGIMADMTSLPFVDGSFDKTVSIAALEFVADAKRAVAELFRVTKSGGAIVVATLNSLSPWAARRSAAARRDPDSIFNRVFFRSPAQLLAAAAIPGIVRTAVHFAKEDDPATFDRREKEGKGLETGAFVAARWLKP
jgi:ubiquinone/menaquinone biosynthesis C-methylase UbiE